MSSTSTKWILELVDRVSAPMKKITNVGRRAEKTTNRVSVAMNRLKNTALATFGALAVFRGIGWIAKLGLDAETTEVKFGVMLGGADKAIKMISSLDKLANATPFDNADLKKSAELLLNFGTAGDKIIPTIKMLGDVSGGNKQRLNSLTLAYAQVQSAGKLMGQDLLQMINAGFNPLQTLVEKTGKSYGYWKDQMSKGNVTAQMVTETMQSATAQGGKFYKMMEKIAETGQGSMSTFFGVLKVGLAEFSQKHIVPFITKIFQIGVAFIKNISPVTNALRNLAAPFKPLFAAIGSLISLIFGFGEESFKVSTIIETLSTYIDYLAIGFEVVSNGVQVAISVIKPFVPFLKVIAVGYGIWIAYQWALNAAMMANPVGLVVAGIVLLIGIIKTAYNRVGWFRGAIDAIWVSIKGFGNAIKEFVIDRIKGMIKGITGIGETLMLFFKGDWKKAWEVGKQATKDLIGVDAGKNAISNMKNIGKDAAKAYKQGVESIDSPKVSINGKSNTKLGANPTSDQLAAGGLDTSLGRGDSKGGSGSVKNGISGSKGQGKIITQNLNITNHFNVDKDARISMEDLADVLAGKLNDKLRDGLIALN